MNKSPLIISFSAMESHIISPLDKNFYLKFTRSTENGAENFDILHIESFRFCFKREIYISMDAHIGVKSAKKAFTLVSKRIDLTISSSFI